MDSFDAIIVGSGPAGTMAALALEGKRVLMLDVGRVPPALPPEDSNLYQQREQTEDLFDLLIGKNFDALHNLHRRPTSLKLKAPLMRYITDGAAALSPVRSRTFEPVMSFAAGGLANAWGAGVYRFTARDLAGFPVTRDELDPYYDRIVRHMGVSGANDDLVPWLGEDNDLQPPVELSRFAGDLLANYRRRRACSRGKA